MPGEPPAREALVAVYRSLPAHVPNGSGRLRVRAPTKVSPIAQQKSQTFWPGILVRQQGLEPRTH